MQRILRLSLFGALAAFLAGCPGLSDQGPADVQGTWSGTYTHGGLIQPETVYAAIEKDGYAFIYAPESVRFFVLPPLTDQRSFSGTGYAHFGCLSSLPPCVPQGGFFIHEPIQLEGTAYPDLIVASYIEPTVSCGIVCDHTVPAQAGAFKLTPSEPYTGTPKLLPGQWDGFYAGGGTVDIVVAADGTLSGSDFIGCSLTGSIHQVAPQDDVFEVHVQGAYSFLKHTCGVGLDGLGFLTSTPPQSFQGAGTYFLMGLTDSQQTSAYVLGFRIN